MNCYATLTQVKADLGITDTNSDTRLLDILHSVSRVIDNLCDRHFYVETATRYFGPGSHCDCQFDDLLSVTTFTTDSEIDGTYDGETWTQNTDYILLPVNSWPKYRGEVLQLGNYFFRPRPRYVKLIGRYGFGDGTRATPYDALGALTATIADTTGTTITVSSTTGIEVGMTLRIESEDMFVLTVTAPTTITVARAVNGTTAAVHTAAAISVYKYPYPIQTMTRYFAAEEYKTLPSGGIQSEMIGAYQYSLSSAITSRMGEWMATRLQSYVRRNAPV